MANRLWHCDMSTWTYLVSISCRLQLSYQRCEPTWFPSPVVCSYHVNVVNYLVSISWRLQLSCQRCEPTWFPSPVVCSYHVNVVNLPGFHLLSSAVIMSTLWTYLVSISCRLQLSCQRCEPTLFPSPVVCSNHVNVVTLPGFHLLSSAVIMSKLWTYLVSISCRLQLSCQRCEPTWFPSPVVCSNHVNVVNLPGFHLLSSAVIMSTLWTYLVSISWRLQLSYQRCEPTWFPSPVVCSYHINVVNLPGFHLLSSAVIISTLWTYLVSISCRLQSLYQRCEPNWFPSPVVCSYHINVVNLPGFHLLSSAVIISTLWTYLVSISCRLQLSYQRCEPTWVPSPVVLSYHINVVNLPGFHLLSSAVIISTLWTYLVSISCRLQLSDQRCEPTWFPSPVVCSYHINVVNLPGFHLLSSAVIISTLFIKLSRNSCMLPLSGSRHEIPLRTTGSGRAVVSPGSFSIFSRSCFSCLFFVVVLFVFFMSALRSLFFFFFFSLGLGCLHGIVFDRAYSILESIIQIRENWVLRKP